MGQYFALVNLDKKQWIHAHRIGNGLKIGEQTNWKYSTEVVAGLLMQEMEDESNSLIGSWHNDRRVGFVGDYGDSHAVGEVPLHQELIDDAEKIYSQREADGDDWTELSDQVRAMMTQKFGVQYENKGCGWLDIVEPKDGKIIPNMTPDMILTRRND